MPRTATAVSLERPLLDWLARSGRTLEVRSAVDPWQVLVGEVMSQQTQIERIGLPWRRFIERWPSPAALANAETGELLRAWAGLGYNRRALALREAARSIIRDHGGLVPDDLAALVALPGIGPYTARAILAQAFRRPVAPLDVNVARVVRRVLGSSDAPRRLQERADALVSRHDPGRWVWAVMDLAATTCTIRAPRCGSCPIAGQCRSRGTLGKPSTRRGSGTATPFERTDRWLRGAVLARLREAPDGRWTSFDGPVGERNAADVARILGDLEADGFLERQGTRARLV